MCAVSDEAWTAVQERVRALLPVACPQCGSREVFPTFLAPHEWECLEPECLAVWSMAA